MNSVQIEIDGQMFTDFVSLEFSRDQENLTCEGTLTASWPGAEIFAANQPPMREMEEGAKIVIHLDGKKAGTGRIDKRQGSGSPTSYQVAFTFRGLAAALVDSSADHPSGQENKKPPGEIAKKLADGYESKVIDKSKEKRKLTRYVVREGETVERAIRTATREFGLIAVENEDGDVEIKERDADEGEGQDLVLGADFTEWSVSRDIAPRYSETEVKGSKVATDESYGKDAEEMSSKATDEAVKFKKKLHVQTDGDQDKETLKKRAITEARRRAAQSITVELTMDGFTDASGELWKVGRLHTVVIPIEGLDEQLIIKAVKFSLSEDALETQLSLVPKEAFNSEEGGGEGKGGDKKSKASKSTKSKSSKKGDGAPTGPGLFNPNYTVDTIKTK